MPQVERTLVTLASPTMAVRAHGSWPCQGVYHHRAGTSPSTAMIATHYQADFSTHYLAELMAQRGCGFLGWNTRYLGDDSHFALEHALVDIGVGVRWLREQAGVERIVLLGNSGGASLMGAYQSQAVEPNIGPTPGLRLPDAVLDLPAADMFVALCAHPGRPEVLTSWLDPSVVNETDPVSCEADLDMYNTENGPPYPPEFVDRYRAAQVARNDRISRWALAELDRLPQFGAWDRVFPVHRAWADLRFLDLSLDPSDREVGCYGPDPRLSNYGGWGLAMSCTLRSWLSMWSLSHSQCRSGPHLRRIKEPSLVVYATGDRGCYPSDADAIYNDLASPDKAVEAIPGDHYLENPPGARDALADLLAAWLSAH